MWLVGWVEMGVRVRRREAIFACPAGSFFVSEASWSSQPKATFPQHPSKPGSSSSTSTASFGIHLLSWVSCLVFVLLVQSKEMLNYLGSHIGISFKLFEEMGPGVQSIVGDNGNSLNSFNKCLLSTYHVIDTIFLGQATLISRTVN